MNEWTVSTAEGDTNVKAVAVVVTHNGDILFKDHRGELQRAFARGQWTQCVLLTAPSFGYGG